MRVSLHVCPFLIWVDYRLSIHPSTKRLERAGQKRKVVERDGRRGKQFKILNLLPMWVATIDMEESV